MWELKQPKPVKLILGILAASRTCLDRAGVAVESEFGEIDLISEVWPFTHSAYYADEMGADVLRQFVSLARLIAPGQLAQIKHKTNDLERRLAEELAVGLPRPVNLDPGIIEPSKLVLATTKNYSHRIYIGNKMYAEVTLIYEGGKWRPFDYTYPDYRQQRYHEFFTEVRKRLLEQLRS